MCVYGWMGLDVKFMGQFMYLQIFLNAIPHVRSNLKKMAITYQSQTCNEAATPSLINNWLAAIQRLLQAYYIQLEYLTLYCLEVAWQSCKYLSVKLTNQNQDMCCNASVFSLVGSKIEYSSDGEVTCKARQLAYRSSQCLSALSVFSKSTVVESWKLKQTNHSYRPAMGHILPCWITTWAGCYNTAIAAGQMSQLAVLAVCIRKSAALLAFEKEHYN